MKKDIEFELRFYTAALYILYIFRVNTLREKILTELLDICPHSRKQCQQSNVKIQ